jgi:hypothetical protein
MLAPHVDRNPLVSSAIINVDQDVDEPWPLEVIGHDGIARNVTMVPGDLVLYESHSVIHGRQFPLKGRFMANVCKWPSRACRRAPYGLPNFRTVAVGLPRFSSFPFNSRILTIRHSHPL